MQVHIPKCAGTAVGSWLSAATDAGLTTGFGAFYPDFDLTEDALWNAGLRDFRVTTASAHNVRVFIPSVWGRRVHYFTLLRDPLARTVSAFRYMLQERVAYRIPHHVVSLEELARWILGTRSSQTAFHQNEQTNHLALYTWCATTGGRCTPTAYGTWSASDHAAYRRERLAIAKDALRGFLVTGTVERLEYSLKLVRDRSAAIGIRLLPPAAVERVNVTHTPPGDIANWLASDPVADRLRERLAVDGELYAYASGLLDAAR